MTGKYLVLLREEDVEAGIQTLGSTASLRVARSAEFKQEAINSESLADEEAVVFDSLAVAVVNAPPDQIQSLTRGTSGQGAILAIEPERIVYAIQADDPLEARLPVEYLQGYRDAVNHLVERILTGANLPGDTPEEAVAAPLNESQFTWGLQRTGVATSQFTGQGIRVAVLDTGIDLGHPDFVNRENITAKSFVQGEIVDDAHGHGTHCIGTACGPRAPSQLPRYGVACEAEIFAGKVLNNQGSGGDSNILAGIDWAVESECQIVSMSLGSPVLPGGGSSVVFEQVARRALNAGTCIIAAAGNDSARPGYVRPVGHPANCLSIMAVAALDRRLSVAPFSNGGINPQGGQVDIAGPGVEVRSSWPRPLLHNTISGTSMATPHVAGIAALIAQQYPAARGRALASRLKQTARHLSLLPRDVGAGLAQV